MTKLNTILVLLVLAVPAGAADLLRYAVADGTIKSVPVEQVRRESETEFVARVRVAGRLRTLRIPTRMVVSFVRGSSSDINQWSKQLAKGRRLMAAGQIATEGTVPGAEELFIKCAYSTERGTRGQEATEQIHPWHNMYGLFHLIEARYKLGLQGKSDKLVAALSDIEQFEKRSAGKERKLIDWEVPGAEGSVSTQKVYCFGENRLSTQVMIYKARVLAAQGKAAEAKAAYDAVLDHIRKSKLSPVLMTTVILETAGLEAKDQDSAKQEQVFASAGNRLSAMASSESDRFGQQTLRRAANQALLKGANLLLRSAQEGKLTYDPPLRRFQDLKTGKGGQDPAVYMGAQAGIGICLTEKGEGKAAYEALLEVIVRGYDYPAQMARALFYISKAAKQYAKELDDAGGKGDILRAEADRWRQDLLDRYPSSEEASKARAK